MSWISRLREGLRKTSDGIGQWLTGARLDAATLEALEEALIAADVGVATAQALIEDLRTQATNLADSPDALRTALVALIAQRLAPYARALPAPSHRPQVLLAVGVNGNGKTTTLGKLAYQARARGERVLLVAADTFRAAAVEQCRQWAQRAGADFHHGDSGADPAAVAYRGVQQGVSEGYDLVAIDTAGRLHTKDNLMAELAKIRQVIAKACPGAPHETLLVLDATTGGNALQQVRAFAAVAGVTGLIVTKLDGTAKAGVLLALTAEFRLPVYAIGIGEGTDDLQPFTAMDYAQALVGGASD